MSKLDGNKSTRLSSPAGVQKRHDRRLNSHPKGGLFPKSGPMNQHGKAPGSRNPRKVGR